MSEVRNGKKMDFRRIYSQVAKYGKLISELAEEYGMSEETFKSRLEKGLETKLFSNILKADERNLKKQKRDNKKGSTKTEQEVAVEIASKITEVMQEEKFDMVRKNKKRAEQVSKRQEVTSENISVLEDKKATINGKITDKEKFLDEAIQILVIREETVTKTQQVFDEAKKALEKAKSEFDDANKVVTQCEQSIKELKSMREKVESQIIELKNKTIYLVAPGYTGEKPAFGTFYSTTKVQGYDTISVQKISADYAITPELNDMVIVAGYDSYKEYMEGLGFVMLCKEYAGKKIDHTVLVNDERIEKLLKAHI